jgi:hypothetical protein
LERRPTRVIGLARASQTCRTKDIPMSVVSAHDPLSAPDPAASGGGTETETLPVRPLRRIAVPPATPKAIGRTAPDIACDANGIDGNGRHEAIEREEPALRVIELARALSGRIRKRPLTSLGVALGVGFLIGGALTFRAGRIALAVVVRRVAREVLKQVL